ncbi:MAG: glycosyltransferase [Acidobacteria bacterium]|nr:glycosyltransferase [Acidobacteriota bacterium]
MTPRVSVLLPVLDARGFLDACLTSVERQTFRDFELVAVDDGSRDGSGDLLESWAQIDPRIRVFRRPHGGLVSALNAGLELCRAPLVARMDADDACHPRRLELQLRWLASHPDAGVVSCLVRHIPVHRVAEGFRIYETWLNGLVSHEAMVRERFVESPLAHPSALIRRQVLEAAGGWRDEGWPEDYDLWLRLVERGVRFGKTPQVLYFWREHAGRLTRTDGRYSVENFLRAKACFLVKGPLAGGRPVIVWGAGQTGRRLSKHLLRAGAAIAAFVDIDPAKIGRTVRGVPVHSPDDLPVLRTPESIVLAAVASRGARELIRQRLKALELVEGREFYCVA